MLLRAWSPNIATPTLAVTGSPPSGGWCSRIALAIPSAASCASAALQRGRIDGELVAAEPGQGVAGAAATAQDVGNFLDQAVAGRVAIGVVDLLEVVEVEHQDRAGGALASRPRHRQVEVLVEAAAVLQAGQRILAGLALQLLHALVAAPDEDQSAEQGGDGDADPAEQQRQADVGSVRVADDQQPGAVGDLQRRPGGVLEFPRGADDRAIADPQLDRVGPRDRADRGRGEVGDLEAAAGEADERGATLGDGPQRGAVAVDRAEDVDADAAEQQRQDSRWRPALRCRGRGARNGARFGSLARSKPIPRRVDRPETA